MQKQGPTNGHEDLAIEVTQTLGESPYTRAKRLKVVATGSGILLRGNVETYFQKQMAQETAMKTIRKFNGYGSGKHVPPNLRNDIEVE
jgi:osmotically-inducible protein OsmY